MYQSESYRQYNGNCVAMMALQSTQEMLAHM
jgi:hypothetical protein